MLRTLQILSIELFLMHGEDCIKVELCKVATVLSHLGKTNEANVQMEHGGICKLRHSMGLSEEKPVELDN